MSKKSIQFFSDREQLLGALSNGRGEGSHDESDYNRACYYWH